MEYDIIYKQSTAEWQLIGMAPLGRFETWWHAFDYLRSNYKNLDKALIRVKA
jgi:hypothetical protein